MTGALGVVAVLAAVLVVVLACIDYMQNVRVMRRRVPQRGAPSLFPTWDEHLDRLAADVDGTSMLTLVEAAEQRAEGAEPPSWEPPSAALTPPRPPPGPGAASPKPPPLQVDPAIIEARGPSGRLMILPDGIEYQPLPQRGRYANCTHADAEFEDVYTHGSPYPVRRFVTACVECDWEANREANRRAFLAEMHHPMGVWPRCAHDDALVLTAVHDPETGEHLGDVDCCPTCFEDANGEPPPEPGGRPSWLHTTEDH
jgi:hypothetical protein